MRRRALVGGLGGAAAVWATARAQQAALPVIGFVRSASFDGSAALVAAFRDGLRDAGYVEGRNVAIAFRSAEGHNDRLPAIVADLIRVPAAVIIGNDMAALRAKDATATIPIVFAYGGNPVREGFVASLNRPGGNVTGVTFLGGALAAKQLELLRDLLPGLATVALLLDTNNPAAASAEADIQAAARELGIRIVVVNVGSEHEIEAAFDVAAGQQPGAALIVGSALFLSRSNAIVALAARHALPAMYSNREFVPAGGLMSYSGSITEAYRQIGLYAGRILTGARAADLPVVQGTRVELAINLATARRLGLTIPPNLLARADEVIE